jgi:hypothetical protein
VSLRKVSTDCSRRSEVTGFFPSTRRELSPRPIPSCIRPPEIRLRVANRLEVTVMSRTAGLVTQVPSRMFFVFAAIKVSSGYGSSQSMWESKIHPYSKPADSACRVSAMMRSTGMSGFMVMPNFIGSAPDVNPRC